MIKKSPGCFCSRGFFCLGVCRHGLRTHNCSALALSDNHGIVSKEKGGVMRIEAMGKSTMEKKWKNWRL
jgi:hypothetical protein